MKAYHISRHFIGHTVTFEPRIPVTQFKEEINLMPRICASENLSGCWSALNTSDLFQEMRNSVMNGFYFFVYELDGDFINSPVKDVQKTGEVISYSKTEGKLVECFYVRNHKIYGEFEKVKEYASIEEGVNHYQNDETYAEFVREIERTIEKENGKTNMENLRAYLIHYKKCLNLSGIEIELNLPRKTIEHYRSGRRGISEEHEQKLETFFKGMGYDEDRIYDVII